LSAVWVCSCDVGDFGRTSRPYVVYDGRRLPFGDEAFDTTLLLLTLHHCDDPERVLDEARRVTRHRLIVTESIFENRWDRFWLDLLDRHLNARRHGGAMNVPLAFRRPDEWRALFAAHGIALVQTRWLGGWWERLVHHPILFVLDARTALASTPP
jgi:SAM-dependent methyltransferase